MTATQKVNHTQASNQLIFLNKLGQKQINLKKTIAGITRASVVILINITLQN